MKIWIICDQDNEPTMAFKKKPTIKSLMKHFELTREDGGREIAEDLLATATSVDLV